MDLKGKKLLFLDGSGLACNAVIRAKQMGIWTIVANFYGVDRSPAKKFADEITREGGMAVAYACNVLDRMAVEAIPGKGLHVKGRWT